MTVIDINEERLHRQIEELGKIGQIFDENGNATIGVNSVAFSDENISSRIELIKWIQKAGLEVRIDQIGNIYAILPGKNGEVGITKEGNLDGSKIVVTGSHIDSVETGGRYDGRLGVLGGIEALTSMKEKNIAPEIPMACVAFTAEEGAVYKPAMIGSAVFTGKLDLEEAKKIKNDKDPNLTIAIGLDKFRSELEEAIGRGDIEDAPELHHWINPPGKNVTKLVHAAIELHIEQGPILEDRKITVTPAEAVQGISQRTLVLETEDPTNLDVSNAAMEIIRYVRHITGKNYEDVLGKTHKGTVGFIEIERSETTPYQDVKAIAYEIAGTSAHAGCSPMSMRNDPAVAASLLFEEARDIVLSINATEGKNIEVAVNEIALIPNTINVVPAKANFTIDFRNASEADIATIKERLSPTIELLQKTRKEKGEGVTIKESKPPEAIKNPARKLEITVDLRNHRDEYIDRGDGLLEDFLNDLQKDNPGLKITSSRKQRIPPARFDEPVTNTISEATRKIGTGKTLGKFTFGAGHDTCNFAFVTEPKIPSGMVAVPSRGGYSHNVLEFTEPGQVVAGVKVLAYSMLKLSRTKELDDPDRPPAIVHPQNLELVFPIKEKEQGRGAS